VSIAEAAAMALLDDWRHGSGDFPVTQLDFQDSANQLAIILDGTRTR
jgi:hypothetical protein